MDGGVPHRRYEFGPVVIGLLGVAAGAFIVALYHCLVNKCCCYQRLIENNSTQQENEEGHQVLQINPDIHRPRSTTTTTTTTTTTSSSSSPVLQLIPVFRYTKGCKDGICAVCLSEFKDGEMIRVLPECMHLFHVGCIDMWLNSHSNCPLCRTDIVPSFRRIDTVHPQHDTVHPQHGNVPPQHVVLSIPNFSVGGGNM